MAQLPQILLHVGTKTFLEGNNVLQIDGFPLSQQKFFVARTLPLIAKMAPNLALLTAQCMLTTALDYKCDKATLLFNTIL